MDDTSFIAETEVVRLAQVALELVEDGAQARFSCGGCTAKKDESLTEIVSSFFALYIMLSFSSLALN